MVKTKYVGVIGAGECSDRVYKLAWEVGHGIAHKGWILVCGGLRGVMEGAAKGCTEAGGLAVGVLPGLDRAAANPFIKISIPTGMGEGRNFLVVRASDVLIAISGGYGTLSEIALALKTGKTVIGLETWKDIKAIQHVSTAEEAIEKVGSILSEGLDQNPNAK